MTFLRDREESALSGMVQKPHAAPVQPAPELLRELRDRKASQRRRPTNLLSPTQSLWREKSAMAPWMSLSICVETTSAAGSKLHERQCGKSRFSGLTVR